MVSLGGAYQASNHDNGIFLSGGGFSAALRRAHVSKINIPQSAVETNVHSPDCE